VCLPDSGIDGLNRNPCGAASPLGQLIRDPASQQLVQQVLPAWFA
jgi:hypothetical protein